MAGLLGALDVSSELAARLVAVAAGVWLMLSSWALDYGGAAQTNDRIVGPIAGAFAFVACWEVLMAMRWATLPLGVWLVVAPAILQFGTAAAWASSVISGLVIAGTSLVGHDVSDQFGGGWRSVRPGAWRT